MGVEVLHCDKLDKVPVSPWAERRASHGGRGGASLRSA